jgi:hypothetical protein
MLNSVPPRIFLSLFSYSILLFIPALSVGPLSILLMCARGGLVHWAKLVFMALKATFQLMACSNSPRRTFSITKIPDIVTVTPLLGNGQLILLSSFLMTAESCMPGFTSS